MHVARILAVGAIGLLLANNLERFTSSLAAEPAAVHAPNVSATQAAAATEQSDDVARASALLAEFRTAMTEEERWASRHAATQSAAARRSQIDVGRDLTKLSRSAVPLLVETLNNDPDPKVAAAAALALGRIGDPRAGELMLKILQSVIPAAKFNPEAPPPGQLRAQACVCALGELREPRAVAPILALERMRDERSDLIEKIGFEGHRWEYMCGIMPVVCGDAIERIGEPAAPELVKLLSNTDGETRATAAEFLGRFGVHDDKFRGGMIMGARFDDPRELASARNKREALERAASDRVTMLAGKKLIELMHDKEFDVRRSATKAVGNLRIASAVGPLIERLHDEEPWVRLDAIEALGQIGDPTALDALAPLLKNPGPDQNDYAERSIAMIGGPKAFALLKSGLLSDQWDRRRAAVHGLLELRTPEAVDLMITALKDEDRNVRCDAAQYLGWINRSDGPRAVEPLIAAVRDGDQSVRVLAMRSLGSIADPRAVDAATAALKDSDFEMQAAGLEALGRIRNAKSVEPVAAMLKVPDKYIRLVAVHALTELNPPNLSDFLRPLLKDYDNDVRERAASALSKLAKPEAAQTKDR